MTTHPIQLLRPGDGPTLTSDGEPRGAASRLLALILTLLFTVAALLLWAVIIQMAAGTLQ